MKKSKNKRGKAKKPGHRFVPKFRIQTPLYIETKEVYPTLPFSRKRFPQDQPFFSMEPRRKIYPTGTLKDDDIHFSCMFECGNLESVYVRCERAYEIHILADPGRTAQWFFFKCTNVLPGEYTFIITGFHRDTGIHHHGIAPVAISMNERKNGLGWRRIGHNFNYWKSVSGHPSEYTISFKFNVEEPDTMYFAYTYPYTFTRVNYFLESLPQVEVCKPATTTGGIDIPMVFWDADNLCYKKLLRTSVPPGKKPMIVLAARHHPGETCGSYAMEGFMKFITSSSTESNWLKSQFSILIIPMINIDGVVCGFYRPGLGGVDINRIWKKPNKNESRSILRIVDKLAETRRILFFLDFHGHLGLWNTFSYGVRDKKVPLNEYQGDFSTIMERICKFFEKDKCNTLGPKGYDRTMRVAFHNRYQVPFSYTLEMSIGGCSLVEPLMQFTPNDYRFIGEMTGVAIYKLFTEKKEITKGIAKLTKTPKVIRPQSRRPKKSMMSQRRTTRAMTPSFEKVKKYIEKSAHSEQESDNSSTD